MTDPGPLETALADSLDAAQLSPRYDAGAELARHYARLLDAYPDDPDTFKEIGPRYLAALTALGLTTAPAAAKGGTEPDAKPGNPLDELRDRRARKSRAPGLDAAAT